MKAFGNIHPFVSMIYFTAVTVIAMFIWNPVLQLLALTGGVGFCLLLLRKADIRGSMGFYILLFLLIAVTNPLFSHNGTTPLFFLNGNPVTLEAFVYGAAVGVMVIAVMLWCKCTSEIMTSDKFLYLFGKTVPKLSLVLSMALRFIPLFKKQMHKVSRTQKAMGLYTSESYLDKMQSGLRVFSVLITWSLENAMETSASMQARGYGLKGRSSFSLFRFTPKDGVLLGTCILLLAAVLTGTGLKVTAFSYYPAISRPDTSLPALVTYTAFGLLAFLPFVMEIGENWKWKYYRSKI